MKLRVGIVTPALFYVPYWAAQAKGWSTEFGLDVEITDLGGIIDVTNAIKTGEIGIGVGSPEHVVCSFHGLCGHMSGLLHLEISM
jgi:ABC-type nitrate/sulfonate/bicarbonate transport system substrate-binding protein